jgi:molybdate transport system substrate-binding protein
MFKRLAVLVASFVAVSTVHAAEVKCLCPVAMRALLGELTAEFERASGHKLAAEFATLGAINGRIAKGEVADVAVVLPRQAEELEKQGRLVAGSRVELARAGYGVIVRKGASKPDLSSVDALKRTLASAKSISYGDPAAGGPAGIYVAGLIMAGVVANSKNADAAGSFIKFLSSPPAKDAMRAKGFETR